MQILGFLRILTFYTVWIGSVAYFPFMFFSAYFGIYWPIYFLISYYSFRFVFPADRWYFIKALLHFNETPYCNSQNMIFVDGAKPPKPDTHTMVAMAPHGILTIGFTCLAGSIEMEPSEIKWLVTDALKWLPFIRDIMSWVNIHACNKKLMQKFMKRGDNLALLPGGFEEATMYLRGHHRIFIKNRKGWIKYCLQYGYDIQPGHIFGEELTYWQLDAGNWGKDFRFWLNKMHIPGTIFCGKWWCPYLPDHNIDINVVITKPMKLPQIDNPTPEEVDKYHTMYIDTMKKLFDTHKGQYAATGNNAQLEIF